jgi:hypothetical protein
MKTKDVKVISIILGIILVLYFVVLWIRLFDEQSAFIYHSGTDSFFVVRLKKSLSPWHEWTYFIPFFAPSLKPCFSEIASVRYNGKWSEEKEQFELAQTDVQRWFEKGRKWREMMADKAAEEWLANRRILTMEYRHRRDLGEADLLPDAWKPILASIDQGDKCGGEVCAVDIVIMEGILAEPVEVKVLHGSLLVRGKPAYELSRYCFGSYFFGFGNQDLPDSILKKIPEG